MKSLLITLTCLLLTNRSLFADPRQWDTTGVVIRQGDDLQWEQVAARNEQGDVLVVWSSFAGGDGDIWAQLISPDGTPQWAEGGVIVCGDPGGQRYPAAIAGSDGWIVAWQDYRSPRDCQFHDDECCKIRAQKLNAAGQRQWSADNFTGVEIEGSEVDGFVLAYTMTDDHSGGAILAWDRGTSGSDSIYALRIAGEGTSVWEAPVAVAATNSGSSPATACDDAGNLLIAWEDYRESLSRIRVNKLNSSGSLLWNESGVQIYAAYCSIYGPHICLDGSGGCYVSWTPTLTNDGALHIQRMDSLGEVTWAANGVSCNRGATDYNLIASVNQDTVDGCLLAFHGSPNTVYALKVSPQGSFPWTANGVGLWSYSAFCNISPRAASDGAGGAVVAWGKERGNGYSDVRAARVSASGTRLWNGPGGVPVSEDSLHHYDAVIVPTDSARVLVAWNDVTRGVTGVRAQILGMTSGERQLTPAGLHLAGGLNGEVEYVQAVSTGNGNTAVLWPDRRDERVYTYFQILDSTGHASGASGGDSLCQQDTDPGAYASPLASCPDEHGGFFAVFSDYHSPVSSYRVTRINAAGQAAGDGLGRAIAPVTGSPYRFVCAPDRQGGVYVAWAESISQTDQRVYIARLDSLLNQVWSPPTLVATASNCLGNEPFGIVANSDASCLIAYSIGRYAATVGFHADLFCARVTGLGQREWAVQVSGAFPDGRYCSNWDPNPPPMVADGNGGAYFAWGKRIAAPADSLPDSSAVFAQHLAADSTRLWGTDGLVVLQPSTLSRGLSATAVDAHNNLMLAWTQYEGWPVVRSSVMATKLSPEGNLIWEGAQVCVTDSGVSQLSVTPDGSDGLFAAWCSRDLGGFKIFCRHLDASGQPASDPFWAAPEGSPIQQAPVSYYYPPVAASDGRGHVTLAWTEWQTDDSQALTVYHVRAQRLTLEQTVLAAKPRIALASRFALHPAFPNPFNPTTLIQFDLAVRGRVELRVYNVMGRLVRTLADGVMEAGEHTTRFDASGLASGVYFYRLQAPGFAQTHKMLLLR
ncbi:MAG TPA: T9SS type A sorting domain-containing protein [bacterium]|jgi:hypothetical protein